MILNLEILDYVPRDLTILYLDSSIVSLLVYILAITRAAIRVSYAALSLSAYRGILWIPG